MEKKDILKTLQGEEKILFSKVLDKARFCAKNYEETFTGFMNPYKASKFIEIVRNLGYSDLNIKHFGGKDGSERVIIGFSPEYLELKEDIFPLTALIIRYNTKFSKKLSHREYLGSILALGIDRGKVGDILVLDDGAYVIVKDDIADFIVSNLQRVSSTKVMISKSSLREIKSSSEESKTLNIIVSSLRIDVIISEAFKVSRSKSSEYIGSERVFVNWNPIKSISQTVKEGDLITLRGHGRIKFLEVKGTTKKDRFSVLIEKFL